MTQPQTKKLHGERHGQKVLIIIDIGTQVGIKD